MHLRRTDLEARVHAMEREHGPAGRHQQQPNPLVGAGVPRHRRPYDDDQETIITDLTAKATQVMRATGRSFFQSVLDEPSSSSAPTMIEKGASIFLDSPPRRPGAPSPPIPTGDQICDH